VTETEILEKRRTFEQDRLVFYVKIKATVHLDWLADSVKRLKSDEHLAEHHRKLHANYSQLKAQMDQLRRQLQQSQPRQNVNLRNRKAAVDLVRSAIQSANLPQQIQLASSALEADESYVDAYVIRGQSYLRIASLGFSKLKHEEISTYVERGIADFNHALDLDPGSLWALLGRGDAYTWQKKMVEAAEDYEHILRLDPLFDIARQRLITLHTTVAKKQMGARRWPHALRTLEKVLAPDGRETQSWVVQEKDAYLLRSRIYTELGEFERATEDLTTVIRVDPTNAQALLLRGQLYHKLRQNGLAHEDLDRACLLGAEQACAGPR
jgi:tetratricopeptide (TPR) repeat protein